MKNKHTSRKLFAIAALPVLFLCSCAGPVKKGLTGTAKPGETSKLIVASEPSGRQPVGIEAQPRAMGIAAGIASGLVTEAAKAAVDLAGRKLEEYAKKFEASYSGKNIVQLGEGRKPAFECTFTRTVRFRSHAEAEQAIASYAHLSAHDIKQEGDVFQIEAMRYVFHMIPSRKEASVRFVPKELRFLAPKANQLDRPLKDEPKISFIITLREATQHSNGPAVNSFNVVSEPFGAQPGKENLVNKFSSNLASDWLPAPATDAFSIEVKALETGKGKEKVEKLAAILRKLGDKAAGELGN